MVAWSWLAVPLVLAIGGCGRSSAVNASNAPFHLLPGLAKGPGQTPLPKSFTKDVEKDPFPSAAERGLLP
jgi:hypothetical protein